MQASFEKMPKKIVVLGTGGTIAGRSQVSGDNVGYKAGEVSVLDLLGGISDQFSQFEWEAEQIAQLDSKDMTHAVWHALYLRIQQAATDPRVAAVLITHGTDTLEETAFFLHQSLSVSCPVVLVSAMRPASSAFADGPANLHDAVALLQHEGVTGVCAVSAGKVHGALEVQKMYPYQIDAFSSGESGPLALIEEGRVRPLRSWQAPVGEASLALHLGRQPWPRVEIVSSHAGCTGEVVRALLAASGSVNPLRGLVVAATGNGTLHQDLEGALHHAQEQGVKVVRSSRCPFGALVAGAASSFEALPGLSPQKARIALMLGLLREVGR
jgi:L-asparaginase